MLNDPPHALLNTPTATAPLPQWDEVSIWTSEAWGEVSNNLLWVQTLRPIEQDDGRI